MSTENIAKALQQIRTLAQDRPDLIEATDLLASAISAGSITNSTGVAIGRNIRMVVNNLNLPAETVASLLELRSALGPSHSLELDRYSLGNFLEDKTRDFVGRDYVFKAISEFLATHSKGYFVIEADPGMGKSALLAEYVRRTGCLSHFNMRAIGVVTAQQFLENICTQLIVEFGLPYPSLPAEAGQNGAYLSKLLQEASTKLAVDERLTIAIDALDEVELAGHPSGANILYLPKTLPDHVYFILSRRDVDLPFVVEVPQIPFVLITRPTENRTDVEVYIRRNTKEPWVNTWIAKQKGGMTIEQFVTRIADLSENNFMYLHYVLPEIASGTYQTLDIESLPVGLRGYYDDHWRHMGMTTKPIPRMKIRVVYVLCEVRQLVSRKMVAQFATDESLQVDELV